MRTKQCKKCLQILKVTEFWKNRTRAADGYDYYCKNCKRECGRKYKRSDKAVQTRKTYIEKLRATPKPCDCDNPGVHFDNGSKEWICEVCFKRQDLYARSNYCGENRAKQMHERWQPEFGKIYE